MDYRKFLNKKVDLVLPYFGGRSVDSAERRLRLSQSMEPGWWRFQVEGRKATAVSPADPPDLSAYPRARGHWYNGWLFVAGGEVAHVYFMPQEAQAPLVSCISRRWHHGELIFDSTEFEDEAEMNTRLALEQRTDIKNIKGVSATLRAAFGYALLSTIAQERSIPVSPREVVNRLADIAHHGMAGANAFLDELTAHRTMEHNRRQSTYSNRRQAMVTGRNQRRNQSLEEQVAGILDKANANLVNLRQMEDGFIEVTYYFMDERFISLADANTFQVIDAGICLSGADREVTLESLPGVIREAIETGQLYITRH